MLLRSSSIWTVLVSLCLAGSGKVFAADMAVKAPPPVPAPVVTWTGFYLGGNIGGGWSNQTFIDNFSAPFGATDATPNSSGVVGGLQAGYNYQINWLLLGIEGDFTWSGLNGSGSCFPLLAPQTCTADPRWIGDVAGRLGGIVGPALFYVKGGPAWVHDTYTDLALPGAPVRALPGVLFSAHETTPGWTVGGGVEYLFLPNWSARLEYDYFGFRDENVGFNGGPGNFFSEVIKQNVQTVTIGVNYHFGPVYFTR